MSFIAVGGTLIAGGTIGAGTIAAGAALTGVAGQIYGDTQKAKATNNLVNSQKQLAANLKYEPIDIEKLKTDATNQAIANATQSLALERQLQPDVAKARETNAAAKAELSRQVNSDLALGGNLPPDLANSVTAAGRVIGDRSGGGNPNVPLTASLLGLSSLELLNQRRAAAANLTNTQPLPVAGLDPGALASLQVANNAANNQFNLEKAGVDSNINQGVAAARASQIGGQVGEISSLANLLGKGIGSYVKPSGGGGLNV